MGRPSAYKSELHDDWAWSLAIDGKTDKEIAQEFGVSEVTLNAWKKQFPSFLKSIRNGKETADAAVKKGLYKRAVGCKVTTTRKRTKTCDDGSIEEIEETQTTELPPDVKAQSIWLMNRQPDNWKNRREEKTEIEILPAAINLNDVIKEIENPSAKTQEI